MAVSGHFTKDELAAAIDAVLERLSFGYKIESNKKRVLTMLSLGSSDGRKGGKFIRSGNSNLWKTAAMVIHDADGRAFNPAYYTVPMIKCLWQYYHSAQNDLLRAVIDELDTTSEARSKNVPPGTLAINEQGFMAKLSTQNQWEQLGHERFCDEIRKQAERIYKDKEKFCTAKVFDCCIYNVIFRILAAGAVGKTTKKSKKTHLEAIAHFAVILMLMYRNSTRSSQFTLVEFKARNENIIDEGVNYAMHLAATTSFGGREVLTPTTVASLHSPYHSAESMRFMDFGSGDMNDTFDALLTLSSANNSSFLESMMDDP